MDDQALAQSEVANRTAAVPWAVYLGMSWTWVIGMFLPVLLVRDFGVWGWVVFAVPNVLGAGAMGWVMRTRAQSERIITTHADACRVFSLVTIAFHLFFVCWMLPQIVGEAGWVAGAVVAQLAFTPLLRGRGQLIAAAITLAVSVTIAALLWRDTRLLALPGAITVGPGPMIGLALVCVLGFVTCPYLDLTFHRARRSTTDAGAKLAFGLGFGVVFASMIVLTLLYARGFDQLKPTTSGTHASLLVALHIAIQSALTTSLHARALLDHAQQRDDVANFRAGLGLALATGLAGAMVAYFARSNALAYAGLTIGEIVYRLFMSFYGLLFPAYVLTSLLSGRPLWRGALLVVGIALPLYWLAFIERQMAFAIVGVLLVLAGSWLARKGSRSAAEPIA